VIDLHHFGFSTCSQKVRSVLDHGVRAPEFAGALRVFLDTLDRMESELAERPWLSGATFGLADSSLLPYVLRLEHLALDPVLDPSARPRVADCWNG
jgi:glutathione S-transferase